MTTELATVATEIARARSSLDGLATAIDSIETLTNLREARARIEALRAWAKVHASIRDLRLDLLRAEVAALVRIVALGGLDELPKADRDAAAYLADLTSADRDRVIVNSRNVTTAAGLVRALWAVETMRKRQTEDVAAGAALATLPPSLPLSREALRQSRRRISDFAASLQQVVEDYTAQGVPFSVSDVADEVIEQTSLGEDTSVDETVRIGVATVIRRAVKLAPSLTVDGTTLPRCITVRADDSKYVRVPLESATLAHYDEMIALRREQLAQDLAAVERHEQNVAKLRKLPGAEDESRIGDLLAAVVINPATQHVAPEAVAS